MANAGGDQTITLPQNAIYINGSKSSDDLGIVSYSWTRESSSLAIGTIVGNSDKEAVLIVSNFIIIFNNCVFSSFILFFF